MLLKKYSVFVCYWHAPFKKILVEYLTHTKHLTVAGEGASPEEAIDWLQHNHCDYLIIGFSQSQSNLFFKLQDVIDCAGNTSVIVLNTSENRIFNEKFISMGVVDVLDVLNVSSFDFPHEKHVY